MTPEFSYDSTDDGCEIEEGGASVVEEVGCRPNELRDSCDDTDGPGKENQDEET